MDLPLTTLFVDMNSYFATVEQQVRPELRGRPVGIVPVMADSSCCIAASVEAKRLGIKTGAHIGRARAACPELRLVEARPKLYVEYHHRIVRAVESCLPVHAVHSIDEMACRLLGLERRPERARELALDIKRAIRQQAGDYLSCSIGIAPNRFLAKVASDMHKPDGLTVIQAHELPDRLHPLELTDLPGIGQRMHRRLIDAGVPDVRTLCSLPIDRLYTIWNGVVGRWWWHWLRGHDLPEAPTRRRTVGHSHVLPPAFRSPDAAKTVMQRLIHKAAYRLRQVRYWAARLDLALRFLDAPPWHAWTRLPLCRDTLTILQAANRLWPSALPRKVLHVSVTLSDLQPHHAVTLPLFPQQQRRDQLARAMDRVRLRHGPDALYFACVFHARRTAPTRISFTQIPTLDAFE